MIKVLIVDDDKLARRGLVSLMDWETYGMEVVGDVQNGKTALQFVKEHPVDLVFVDIDMPEMNGIEFMEECRKVKPQVQFVVLSFFENFSYVQATLRLGGLDYISKTSMELDNGNAILQRILEKYEQRSHNTVPPEEMEKELADIWEECRTHHWFFCDSAFERLKELFCRVDPQAPNVRRLEMMIARYIGELEGMLELPESIVPLFSGTEEMARWLGTYRRKAYKSVTGRSLGNDAERILKAIIYMKEHLEENLSTSTVAEHIGCSRSYFCILFKKLSGLSFGDYLQQVRIDRAKELLRNTSDSVTEIAFSSGYNDIYYFNRVFRKAVNCSPMEFRKNRAPEDPGQGESMSFGREFDEKYRYDGKDLGAVCGKNGTVFKVWSPLAEKVELRLYRTGTSRVWMRREMQPGDRGVWTLEFPENLHGIYYDYLVRAGGKDRRTADPYAVGCCCNGARSMVADLALTDPPDFASDVPPREWGERIVYELHIKDFSCHVDSGVPEAYRGKYKAFTVPGEDGGDPVCMAHLKGLGVTHVELMPFFDYGSVDEAGDGNQFNWGYDPVNYNVPEGSYATDASDGLVRIRECKEMIQALHRAGLRVVMDVVYNHTHRADSWLERMVPGYYYRRWEDGRLSNGSGCGNDIAAGRAMVDNYIADSVMYWAREYHVDGFRFDLMGLMTVELMNRIRRELDEAFGPGKSCFAENPGARAPHPWRQVHWPPGKKMPPDWRRGLPCFAMKPEM